MLALSDIGSSVREKKTGLYWCITDVFDRRGVQHVGLLSRAGARKVLTREEYDVAFEDWAPAPKPEALQPPADF